VCLALFDDKVPGATHHGLLGGIMDRASDLRSSGRGFDSQPGRYRAT